MKLQEYRIVMPMSLAEYHIGQLYAIMEAARRETGGGEGVQVLENRPFDNFPLFNGQYNSGQYTYKIYYVAKKAPGWARATFPKKVFIQHEEAWNAFPYCLTLLTNPDYMKDDMTVEVQSLHFDNDRGNRHNAFNLPPAMLEKREIIRLDMAKIELDPEEYDVKMDPQKFFSKKTNRGPLLQNWTETCNPCMCCYKLVSINVKFRGLKNFLEGTLAKIYPKLFGKFSQLVFGTIDQWHGLSIEDIRRLEVESKEELNKKRCDGNLQGTKFT